MIENERFWLVFVKTRHLRECKCRSLSSILTSYWLVQNSYASVQISHNTKYISELSILESFVQSLTDKEGFSGKYKRYSSQEGLTWESMASPKDPGPRMESGV